MEVDEEIDEKFFLEKVQSLRTTDSRAAKCWLLTATTFFPKSFLLHFELYKFEKEAKKHKTAAKCFSDIALSFQNQNAELWNEVNEVTAALRVPENEITPHQEFYVKMFKHVSPEIQHKILLHTLNNHTENNNSLKQCKLILLILKRFPQAGMTHSARLLEMIADGMKQNPQKYQEFLVEEALPLINEMDVVELPAGLVCRLFTISLEYYIRQIIDEDVKCEPNETWDNIFNVLTMCSKILRWELFLPFNKLWGQKVYWDKLVEIISPSPADNTQVLFYATTLFIYSLHCYIKNCNANADETDLNHVLVEGFTEWKVERSDTQNLEPPQISLSTATSKDISKAFVHAAQCWQLLNTEQFQRDFSKLLLTLPLASWISRFLFDLAIYFGHQEEAKKLMNDMSIKSSLVHHLQLLSLNLLQDTLTLQGFDCILKILAELPTTQGQSFEHLTQKVQRHMIFMPLTRKALVQYCTTALINNLSMKLYQPNCPDEILGSLLVLLQLDYPNPRETFMAEQIFALITSRRSFTYRFFGAYIITIDFIEEIMYIWHTHNEDFSFDLGATSQQISATNTNRRSARGVDKNIREDFRKQIARSNEDIVTLVANFITQQHIELMKII